MRLTTLFTLLLTLSLVSLAWAEDSPARPTSGAVSVAPAQGPERKPVVKLGPPRVRLGTPTVRTPEPIQPTAFTPPEFAGTLPMPQPPVPEGGKDKKPEVLEKVPAPQAETVRPPAAPASRPTLVPGTEAPLAPIPIPPEGFVTPLPADACAPGQCVIGEPLPVACMFEGPHGPMSKIYLNFEYLLWQLKPDSVPALVTTSPQDSFGIIGQPGTQVLLEGDIDQGSFHGGRIQAGWWFREDEQWGLVGSFFILQERTKTYTFGSNGEPLYARPFFNAANDEEDSQLVAALDILSGSVTVKSSTQLLGADLNLRANLLHCMREKNCNLKSFNIDALLGVRWQRLDETLTITEDLTAGPQSPEPGARFLVMDQFAAENNFYGGQLGLQGEMRYKKWFLNATAKVGLGVTQSRVNIDGSTTLTLPGGGSQTATGGLLALPTNIGSYSRTSFSVIPEIGVNLGYQFTDHLRLYVGYNALAWTNVARPGAQIDRVVNPTQLPFSGGGLVGPARPAFNFRDSTFWAHGLVAGLEWRF